jgi:hypothetical protein
MKDGLAILWFVPTQFVLVADWRCYADRSLGFPRRCVFHAEFLPRPLKFQGIT